MKHFIRLLGSNWLTCINLFLVLCPFIIKPSSSPGDPFSFFCLSFISNAFSRNFKLFSTMLGYISSVLCCLPILVLFPTLLDYYLSFQDARKFVTKSSLPSVTIFSPRDSTVFFLASAWIPSFVEQLPFRWGHWLRYVKRDFSWASKGDLAREELKSDAYVFLTFPIN